MDRFSVLVDGFNLEMPHGTGVKTYSRAVVNALCALGADVNILFSVPLKGAPHSFEEVGRGRWFGRWRSIKKILGTPMKNLFGVMNPSPLNSAVSKNFDIPIGVSSCSVPNGYFVANMRFKYLRKETAIRMPGRVNIWHATYPLPMRVKGARMVTTIHDLIPLRLPRTTLYQTKFYKGLIEKSLQDSELIFADSEYSKKDILDIFGTSPDKIAVVYPPVAPRDSLHGMNEEALSKLLKRFGLEWKKFILFVGAIEPRKNVRRLIDAYVASKVNGPLVIAGKKAWMWEDEIRGADFLFQNRKETGRSVVLLEHVTDCDLELLYRGASCLVLPSLYEGFGLPPVEAMSLGCPVITSRMTSLPEVCGDAALYVDPYDTGDIQRKMESLVEDVSLQEKLIRAGRERAALYSIENFERRLSNLYSKIL